MTSIKKNVLVFGASEGGKNFIKKQNEYNVLAFIDNDVNKQGTLIHGYPIISPKSMKDYDYDYILIASVYFNPIKKQLVEEFDIAPETIKAPPKAQLKSVGMPFEDAKTISLARKILLELMEMFDDNNVKYFADFGTLLGIARDGDLIPWDDDIDITILETDFKRVVNLFEDNSKDLDKSGETKWFSNIIFMEPESPKILLSFEEQGISTFNNFEIDIWPVTFKEDMAIQVVNRSPRIHFEQQEEINFLGKNISVPFNYEAYLELIYGDWKTPKKDISFADYPLAFKK